MNNNLYFLENLVYEKQNALRTEGMRSQMLARARCQHQNTPHFLDLDSFFQRVSERMAHRSLRRNEQPNPCETAAQ